MASMSFILEDGRSGQCKVMYLLQRPRWLSKKLEVVEPICGCTRSSEEGENHGFPTSLHTSLQVHKPYRGSL